MLHDLSDCPVGKPGKNSGDKENNGPLNISEGDEGGTADPDKSNVEQEGGQGDGLLSRGDPSVARGRASSNRTAASHQRPSVAAIERIPARIFHDRT